MNPTLERSQLVIQKALETAKDKLRDKEHLRDERIKNIEEELGRDERIKNIEEELGIDMLKIRIECLEKNLRMVDRFLPKTNVPFHKCYHYYKTVVENTDRKNYLPGCRYYHTVTCNECNTTWLKEDFVGR